MNSAPFFRYFVSFIFRAKTRQKLLFIAVTGLFLSAFSLMVIQGIMGGLQHGLISRSKSINGHYLIRFPGTSSQSLGELKEILRKEGIPFYSELETEVMLRRKNFVAPAKIHGVDQSDELPSFLKDKDFSGLILGSDLAGKIKSQFMDDIEVIAPGVTDSIMGEVPRFVSDSVSDYLYTEISEVDDLEMFSRLSFVQNLLREETVNQIRVFGELTPAVLQRLMEKAPREARALTWAQLNEALVWSLNLETKVMLFLFISMSLLVAIAITSGLMIFYSKIRRDLMSFWILGMGQKKLMALSFKFTLILSGVTVLVGGIFGSIALRILERFGHELMPDIFVERSLPVQLNFNSIVISLLIPFGISLIFSWFSFAYFRKENQSFVNIVRSLS
jgi:lipoprotein-releasing system permease protein